MSILNSLRRLYRHYRYLKQRQAQRRRLLQLENHMLKDMGLSLVDAHREGRKHFWQP
ncbi:DUF1127 domain-containing protein [Marinobacterium sp. D7]|uniref:DUF1127 domain-containing protein n=1 Tax=Marinobacterium ramblicola TaxID=2849041 RepID=UPI001C2DA59F|nr:DUF1127 domain-containing protein [Marinobacterium ramblicola]MBV1787256.1 DUF1127 domain-containing protein [Marinobacterium ramblicola]